MINLILIVVLVVIVVGIVRALSGRSSAQTYYSNQQPPVFVDPGYVEPIYVEPNPMAGFAAVVATELAIDAVANAIDFGSGPQDMGGYDPGMDQGGMDQGGFDQSGFDSGGFDSGSSDF